jgi:hypothetical protein
VTVKALTSEVRLLLVIEPSPRAISDAIIVLHAAAR